jgi:DNA-binding transcriptional regulator YdaS (Cro superfamily)
MTAAQPRVQEPPVNQIATKIEPEPQTSPHPVSIVERAIEKGITGADLKEIMDLQERWEANQSRKAFDVAMANAQADMPVIVKNRLVEYGEGNKKTSYKHEDLSDVIRLITPVLKTHGLAVRFRTEQLDGGQVRVSCLLTGHGHREETSLQSSRDSSGGKNDIQAVGSVVTYLERYTLKAALGLASSRDDDGVASEGGNATITALQLQAMEKVAAEVAADIAKFCKFLKVETLAELPAKRFDAAMQALEAKRSPL